jgi:hypothetical protein
MPICEYCCEEFDPKQFVITEDNMQFCSDDCLREHRDEVRIGRIEAKKQWELYGDDYDSWYR